MKEIHGNLLSLAEQGKFDVIIHGCNCFHVMGGGIAYQIKNKFPQAYDADLKTGRGDRSKLGTYSFAHHPKANLTIVNAYTQYAFGRDRVHVNYPAIRSVFRAIRLNFAGQKIGYPMIGAGLAGGDWNAISSIIEEELRGEDNTLVIYKP